MYSVWNLYAKAYDLINQNIAYLELLQDVIAKATIQPKEEILDIGAGTGNLARQILNQYPEVKLLCIDVSPEMLKCAKKKFKLKEEINFRLVNVNQGLSLPKQSFDKVILVNTLYALKNPDQTIKEINDVLKPGGKVIIANPHHQAKLTKIFTAQRRKLGLKSFLKNLLFNIPSLVFILFINLIFLRPNQNYFSPEELQKILKKCGFGQIEQNLTYAKQDLLVSAIKK